MIHPQITIPKSSFNCIMKDNSETTELAIEQKAPG